MQHLTANGITLGYDIFGAAHTDAILLISGLGTQMTRWSDTFCTGLATQGFKVIRFDNRDAGGSTHFTHSPSPDFAALAEAVAAHQTPNVPYTLHDMAADAIGLLDALGIERAHVVGRSMGGMIAQLMACHYSQRVLSLTSIMSSTGNPTLPSAAPDVMALLTTPSPTLAEDTAGFLNHRLEFAKRIASPAYPFDDVAQRTMILEETNRAYDPTAFGRQLAAIVATGDLRPALEQVNTPTLVIHGTDDPLIPLACGMDTAASISNAEFMPIVGMGHDLPPQLYAVIIDAIVRTARQPKPLLH